MSLQGLLVPRFNSQLYVTWSPSVTVCYGITTSTRAVNNSTIPMVWFLSESSFKKFFLEQFCGLDEPNVEIPSSISLGVLFTLGCSHPPPQIKVPVFGGNVLGWDGKNVNIGKFLWFENPPQVICSHSCPFQKSDRCNQRVTMVSS